MKHMLPMIIITLAVFALLGVIIYNDTLQIGTPTPAFSIITIDNVATSCSENIGDDEEDAINVLMSKTFHKWLALECRNTSLCNVNINSFYKGYNDIRPDCTDELRIKVICEPVHGASTVINRQEYFLYEGQTTILSCP